jgi:hypothetical protein
MLTYSTPDALRAEPPARRFLHVLLLTALRDKAERLEVRFTDAGSLLYYRVAGRDWELVPPPDEVDDLLAGEVRAAARLVAPERPDVVVTGGVGDARYEPTEAGWLTYQLGGFWVDLLVKIDPRRPWGGITFEVGEADEFAAAAGEALAALAEEDEGE